MKTVFRIIFLFMMIVSVVVFTQSQSRRAGANGAAFLNVGVGAKNVALGSATTALSNDVNQVFWNPAGVALKDETMQVSFNYNKWFAELNHNSAAISYNVPNIGTFALGVITFGASDIPADRDFYPNNPELWPYQVDDKSTDTYNYLDMAVSLTYSRYLLDNLSIGVTAKFINEAIDEKNASAVAFDLGTCYDIGIYNWKVAARMNNLGSDMTFYDFPTALPLVFSVGTSVVPINEDYAKLFLTMDAIKFQDGPQYFFAGGEVTVMDLVSFRGGYKFNYSDTKDDGTSWRPQYETTIEGFSAGLGVKIPIPEYNISLDYSYTDMKLFDGIHRISLNFGLK